MADTTVSGGPWLRKRVDEVDQDFLRDLVKTVVEALMSVDADSVCGAPYGGPGQYGTASTTWFGYQSFGKKFCMASFVSIWEKSCGN